MAGGEEDRGRAGSAEADFTWIHGSSVLQRPAPDLAICPRSQLISFEIQTQELQRS